MTTTAATVKPISDRHPAGLYALFATEMWERFGFYTAAAIMTLYLQRGGFGWTKDTGDQALVELPHVRLRHAADRRLAGGPFSGLPPLGAASAAFSSSPDMRCSGWVRLGPTTSPWP